MCVTFLSIVFLESQKIEIESGKQPTHIGDVSLPINGFAYYHVDVDAQDAHKTLKITMVSVSVQKGQGSY